MALGAGAALVTAPASGIAAGTCGTGAASGVARESPHVTATAFGAGGDGAGEP